MLSAIRSSVLLILSGDQSSTFAQGLAPSDASQTRNLIIAPAQELL